MRAYLAIKPWACLVLMAGLLSGCQYNLNPGTFDQDSCAKPTRYAHAEKANLARNLMRALGQNAIQFVQRGDRMTLIVPTDRYYMFNSPELNDLTFPVLEDVAKLVKLYPCNRVTVASFSDNVGKRAIREKLTKARAETMVTFLWAKGIPAKLLTSESFGSNFAVGNNQLVHGSAYNRRIEIQWWKGKPPRKFDRMDMKMR